MGWKNDHFFAPTEKENNPEGPVLANIDAKPFFYSAGKQFRRIFIEIQPDTGRFSGGPKFVRKVPLCVCVCVRGGGGTPENKIKRPLRGESKTTFL